MDITITDMLLALILAYFLVEKAYASRRMGSWRRNVRRFPRRTKQRFSNWKVRREQKRGR